MPHTAKLFRNGRSQAVRLPAEYRFQGSEVYVRRDPATGDVILSINDEEVTSVSEVTTGLEAVQSGHTARVLVWHPQDRSEEYLTLRKR